MRAVSSYMLLDCKSANALDAYENVVDAHVGLRQWVEADPSVADDLVLIGYDEDGMAVGETVTFRDLPPSTVMIEDSSWLVHYGSTT